MSVFTGTWYKNDGWLHYDYLNSLLFYYAPILRDYADKGPYFSTCFMIFIFCIYDFYYVMEMLLFLYF